MNHKSAKIILFICLVTLFFGLFYGCNKQNIITEFDPMVNFPGKDVVTINFDMTNGVFEGLSLPTKDSSFVFKFKISPKEGKKYYYKIYYQNISYAFRDNHPLSYENFYGSWEDTKIEFKPIANEETIDSIRIVGNPREERKYFSDSIDSPLTDKNIEETLTAIRNDSAWLSSIKEKAKKNNLSFEDQMYNDAIWCLKNIYDTTSEHNNRQWRNPRVGEYEFMLVVVEERALKQIPDYITNISKKRDNQFENPFKYFLEGEGANNKGIYTIISNRKLRARAKYILNNGVYVDKTSYPNANFVKYLANKKVGNMDSLFRYAEFEQYFHNINTNRTISQIQIIDDIQSRDFTINKYLYYTAKKSIIRKDIHPTIASVPAKTILCENGTIKLINPGNKFLEIAKKENVGIKARIGFTYGRFIYKIKFPPLLNDSGVWNGLTNAAWLIYQSDLPWNDRRPCQSGYVKNNYNDNENARTPNTNYSEIDIEMMKTSKYWPSQINKQPQNYNAMTNHNFVFAATNWDLACNDENRIGDKLLTKRKYSGKEFIYNRWTKNSRNITSRVELSNDIFKQPFYYYVIDWRPDKIIWYVGNDLDNLIIVGYMDESFTSIPNNQMVPIITQEYHYSEYWPPIIFDQGSIPYPKNDAVGIIYDLIVE